MTFLLAGGSGGGRPPPRGGGAAGAGSKNGPSRRRRSCKLRPPKEPSKRLVLPQARFQAVQRVLPAESGADLVGGLLQLGGQLVEVLRQIVLRRLDLLFLGDGFEQQITFHFEKRTLT